MTHEREFNFKRFCAGLRFWSCKLIWLFGVCRSRRGKDFGGGVNGRADPRYCYLFEEVEGQASVIDASQLNFRVLLDEGNFKALLHLPLGDLVGQLLHEHLHHIVALCMDDQSRHVIERCRLKVDNDETSTVLRTLLREGVCWGHSQTRAHG